jgi:signal transduction histidine kinase/ActR/RegA family two-component response regulator
MRLSVSGIHPEAGLTIADVNLVLLSDVMAQIRRGETGYAYVVDSDGELIAHSDTNMVLRHTNLSGLPQVHAPEPTPPETSRVLVEEASDLQGQRMLSAHAAIPPVGWRVFVELPIKEAYAPLYASVLRSVLIIGIGLVTAFFSALYLAYRTLIPIRALQAGAARLGSGDLTQRIAIQTGDELEALGNQFNSMAAQLQESYATLELRVEERTRQLAAANAAKSRFIAVASHDLRQPLHALGLFVEQLRSRKKAAERNQLLSQIDLALSAMNELFHELLDLSKLEAGIVTPNVADFPIARLLARAESTFRPVALQKGLSFRLRYHRAWVRSDFVLLERIIQNLVSNALRYTESGSVLVGCRRRCHQLRIEVWDSGPGIPEHQRANIFGEFYRLTTPQHSESGGLGLGLAIVDRLCSLLAHPIKLKSRLGKGSCFAVTVPLGASQDVTVSPLSIEHPENVFYGKHAVIIDDDPLVLHGTGGLLQSWGCVVSTAHSEADLLEQLKVAAGRIDFIICDYNLAGGSSGFEVVARLRGIFGTTIPALIVSGDAAKDSTHASMAASCFLQKPVLALTLRAVMSKLLTDQAPASESAP